MYAQFVKGNQHKKLKNHDGIMLSSNLIFFIVKGLDGFLSFYCCSFYPARAALWCPYISESTVVLSM